MRPDITNGIGNLLDMSTL